MPAESLRAMGTLGTALFVRSTSMQPPTLAMCQNKPRVLPCANDPMKVATLAKHSDEGDAAARMLPPIGVRTPPPIGLI